MTVNIFCISMKSQFKMFHGIHSADVYLNPDSFEKIGRRKIITLIQTIELRSTPKY